MTHVKADASGVSLPFTGSWFTGRMFRGLLKRLGIILLAIAFLGGGLAPVMPANAAVPTPAMSVQDHTMHAHAMAHPGTPCPTPAGKATPCPHPRDCLACVAFDLVVVPPVAVPLRWTRLAFTASTVRLSGATLDPELLPPKSPV